VRKQIPLPGKRSLNVSCQNVARKDLPKIIYAFKVGITKIPLKEHKFMIAEEPNHFAACPQGFGLQRSQQRIGLFRFRSSVDCVSGLHQDRVSPDPPVPLPQESCVTQYLPQRFQLSVHIANRNDRSTARFRRYARI